VPWLTWIWVDRGGFLTTECVSNCCLGHLAETDNASGA
jgi:hypothetical protein